MHALVGSGFKRRFVGLCLPPMVVALADGTLTLLGQSDFYWSNHLAVNEASPFFRMLLQIHPLASLLGLAAWIAIFCTVLLTLRPTLALIASIAVTFAHTIGSGNWLFGHFDLGYQLANGYYLLSACVLGLGIRHALLPVQEQDDDVLRLAAADRLKLGAIAFGLGVLMFLVPWRV